MTYLLTIGGLRGWIGRGVQSFCRVARPLQVTVSRELSGFGNRSVHFAPVAAACPASRSSCARLALSPQGPCPRPGSDHRRRITASLFRRSTRRCAHLATPCGRGACLQKSLGSRVLKLIKVHVAQSCFARDDDVHF